MDTINEVGGGYYVSSYGYNYSNYRETYYSYTDVLEFGAGINPGDISVALMTKAILLGADCPNTVAANEMDWRKTG